MEVPQREGRLAPHLFVSVAQQSDPPLVRHVGPRQDLSQQTGVLPRRLHDQANRRPRQISHTYANLETHPRISPIGVMTFECPPGRFAQRISEDGRGQKRPDPVPGCPPLGGRVQPRVRVADRVRPADPRSGSVDVCRADR